VNQQAGFFDLVFLLLFLGYKGFVLVWLIASCLRIVLAFSTPYPSANETSSAGVWALS
jgi:hypothetical protein